MAERTLTVKIIGDDADLRRAFASSEKAAQGFQGRISGVGVGIGKNFLAAGVAAGATAVSIDTVTRALGSAISEASNLNEQISKSRQIFGDSSAAIEEWSQTTARSMGISQVAALEAAGTFGNLFSSIGLSQPVAAEMSKTLVQLAADMASFNNADPTDMLDRLRSGLAGEAEPLRRYGVFISEAKVQQIALNDSGKESVKLLTDQEKALARYKIIMQDTLPQQGDFARTQDTLANQTRILKGNLNDLSADIGGLLIPMLTDATTAANELFIVFGKLSSIDWSDILPEQAQGTNIPDVPGVEFGNVPDPRNLAYALLPAPIRAVVIAGAQIAGLIEDAEDQKRANAKAAERYHEAPDALDRFRESQAEQREKARQAARALEESQKAFSAFLKGLGLKLDRAEITATLTDNLAVLREIERAIQRQIQREGRTFELEERLILNRADQTRIIRQQAADAEQASQDAFDDLLDSLNLDYEKAQADKSFANDMRTLRAIEAALLERIAEEGKTVELERELFEVRQRQAETRREQAEQVRQRRQERLFEMLGLTAEGERPVPGEEALERRRRSLLQQIKGTVLDTPETRRQLAQIGAVLSHSFIDAGKEVRSAILEMFNLISSALEEGSEEVAETAFVKAGPGKLLEGLGLSPLEEKALRERLAAVGPGGVIPGTGIGAFGITQPTTGTAGVIVVNGNIIVEDPRDADAFIREVQRKANRSSGQRRGVRPGSNRGLG